MSEPFAAFLKIQIDRGDLIRWLDSPAPPASNWGDWRDISTEPIGETELQEIIAKCDQILVRYTNRQILRHRVLASAQSPHWKYAAYDSKMREFVAGSLTYYGSENLREFIFFLTLARGAANYLGNSGYGIAIIDYLLGDTQTRTRAAMRLGPGARSEFMVSEAEKTSALGVFQALEDGMIDLDKPPPTPVDELDNLR